MNPGIKLGILGGGQLARMLALSAHNLGLTPFVLSENPSDPAQQVTAKGIIGSLKSETDLTSFLKQVDVATFESEFLDSQLLEKIRSQHKIHLSPDPRIMGQLQDRLTQKTLLDELHIATAPWLPLTTSADCDKAVDAFSFPFVIKKRRFGYDGYGTFVIRTKADLQNFKHLELKQSVGFIAEKWIPFKRELACIFARNPSGDIVHYPLVETLQKSSRCFWVKGPISHSQFLPWAKKFKKLLQQTKYVGILAVELFDSPQGLLVNELAPRVHNSGHCTLDAFSTSQFDLHLKALLNQPLAIPKARSPGFAMVNLLGQNKKNMPTAKWTLDKNIKLHWYGKTECRPGRKMGHINTMASSANVALQQALKALKGFKL